MNCTYSYDLISAIHYILNIHKTAKNTQGSAEFGDFTVDFDKEGQVVGIEILNASEFVDKAVISKEELEGIKDAQLTITHKKDYTLVWFKLLLPHNIEKTVPLPTPILSSEEMRPEVEI